MGRIDKISGNLVDLFEREIYPGTLVVRDGKIDRVERGGGPYGCYISPGFVDAHVHVESSMMAPAEFARLAAAHGTVAAVADPHEIANVLGIKGIDFMLESARTTPFVFCFGAPSCVPATDLETSGAAIGPAEIETLLGRPDIGFLGEMMNFPGVLAGDPAVAAKIRAARAAGKPVDGHAPGLRGEELRRYAAAGISTDHESLTLEEALEKLDLGMKILIREGSAARSLDDFAGLMRSHPGSCMLCTDDLHPQDLVRGHLDALVRRAVRLGVDPMDALRCACLNPALHYGLDVGLLREGDRADFVVLDDLRDFSVLRTYIKGVPAAKDGRPLLPCAPVEPVNAFAAGAKRASDFAVPAGGGLVNIIEALDGQLVTERSLAEPSVSGGLAVADTGRDILKIAVVNRYADAPPPVGFIKNFGLRAGAVASSVAHDSHNIVAVGASDEDICAAVNLVAEHRGGLALAAGTRREILPLPVAGLMSDRDGFNIAREYERLEASAKELGTPLSAPFMTLSFMALLVIPKLKMSDRGLFDSERFEFTGLWTDFA